jgi:hypothetical protein
MLYKTNARAHEHQHILHKTNARALGIPAAFASQGGPTFHIFLFFLFFFLRSWHTGSFCLFHRVEDRQTNVRSASLLGRHAFVRKIKNKMRR